MRRLATALTCVTVLASGLAACGNKDEVPGTEEPAREGLEVRLEGIDYNVFITRQLNTKVQPDSAYYNGPEPGRGETLYGVFLQVCNNGKEPAPTAEEFSVVDNQGNEYEPTELPEENAFAYHAGELGPKACIPEAGSVAQLGPTAGSMLLFRLPLQATENRPLELEVSAPAGGKRSFELDL
jgi:hypothetical protein